MNEIEKLMSLIPNTRLNEAKDLLKAINAHNFAAMRSQYLFEKDTVRRVVDRALIDVMNMRLKDIVVDSRKPELVKARQLSMYCLFSTGTNLRMEDIGSVFDRDHSTVIYSIDQTRKRIRASKEYRELVQRFEDVLKFELGIFEL